MRVKSEPTGYEIVVTPKSMGVMGLSERIVYGDTDADRRRLAADRKARAEDMADQIRRHVDYVSLIEIRDDSEWVCSHCGSEWMSDDDCNGCCDDDMAEADASAHRGEEQ